MVMTSYYEFSNDQDIIAVQFNNGLRAEFSDQYCTNPACDCSTVGLEFNEVNEDGNSNKKLFSFSLDTHTWEVSNIKMQNANVVFEGLIKEFVTDLDTSLKDKFRAQVKKSKERGEDGVLNWFDDLDLHSGTCFGYSEVYGDSDTEKFFFEYKDQKYFVDDQYCTGPKCKCNEVVLSFIEIIPDRDRLETQFALKVPLGTGDYEIEGLNNMDSDEIKQIFIRYMEHIRDKGVLKKRYTRMKEFGKKRLMRQKPKQETPQAISSKVGRNDPCLCGSGKKYKKCCGIMVG